MSIALLAPVVLFSAIASGAPRRSFRIVTPDGLHIAVQECGNPTGRTVVLIHGLLQSHLSWVRQTEGDFAKRYRIVTYDLRGHGESDAPTDAKYYRTSRRWANELRAVLRATHARKPILVGWSMGGIVIGDYLRTFGSRGLGGLVFLDSWIKAPLTKDRASSDVIARMASPDLAARIDARTAFLQACFLHRPDSTEFQRQLAFNMLTPPKALSAMVDRRFDYDDVARRTRIPVLVFHGDHDALMPLSMARHTAATFPNAMFVVAPNVGHASFFESPRDFQRALDRFVSTKLDR